VEAEELAESLRQHLSRSPTFNSYDAFKDIDIDQDGFITREEFESLLRHYSIPVTQKDLNNLMGIYDKKQSGRVSYTDFAQEVSPKSPHKY
jgi:Ca2+-binding EF-hand superfamily protein